MTDDQEILKKKEKKKESLLDYYFSRLAMCIDLCLLDCMLLAL